MLDRTLPRTSVYTESVTLPNLAELYGYMASRVLDGHVNQVSAPFDEVERLMSTLLDGWENLGAQHIPAAAYAPISASF